MFLIFTCGLEDSLICFLLPWDLTSTVTFLAVSTTNSDCQGSIKVSSAITSNLILPSVFSSNKPFNFLIGTLQFPFSVILPGNKRVKSFVSTNILALESFKSAPSKNKSHSKVSCLSVYNFYIFF